MAVNIGSASVVFERFKALCWHAMHNENAQPAEHAELDKLDERAVLDKLADPAEHAEHAAAMLAMRHAQARPVHQVLSPPPQRPPGRTHHLGRAHAHVHQHGHAPRVPRDPEPLLSQAITILAPKVITQKHPQLKCE